MGKLLNVASKFSVLLILLATALGYAYGESDKRALTAEARQWLENYPAIRFAIDNDYPPFEFSEDKQTPFGISKSYLDNIQQQLKVKFEFVPTKSWLEAIDKMKKGEVDLLPAVALTEQRTEFMRFTKPYIALPQALVSLEHKPEVNDLVLMTGKPFAVISGYFSEELIRTNYPDILLQPYTSPLMAIKAVKRGHVEGTALNFGVASYLIQQHKIDGLKLVSLPKFKVQGLRMGIHPDHYKLVQYFNYAINQMTAHEHQRILSRWVELSHLKGDFISNPPKRGSDLLDVKAVIIITILILILVAILLHKTIRW